MKALTDPEFKKLLKRAGFKYVFWVWRSKHAEFRALEALLNARR